MHYKKARKINYMHIYIIYDIKNLTHTSQFPLLLYFLPGDFFLGDLEANPINSLAFLSNLRMT